jgi:putative membrane protein
MTNGGQGSSVNGVDQTFVTQAVHSNDLEIDQAKPQLNSSNPSVRLFAQTMIRDHTSANAQLAAVAKTEGLTYPTSHIQTGSMGSTGTPPPAANSGNTAPAMSPQAYMQAQVAAHQQAIGLFQGEINNGGSQQIKTVAAQILPLIKNHLAMAQEFLRTGHVTPESTPAPPVGGGP